MACPIEKLLSSCLAEVMEVLSPHFLRAKNSVLTIHSQNTACTGSLLSSNGDPGVVKNFRPGTTPARDFLSKKFQLGLAKCRLTELTRPPVEHVDYSTKTKRGVTEVWQYFG